jgi:hypothetical protein
MVYVRSPDRHKFATSRNIVSRDYFLQIQDGHENVFIIYFGYCEFQEISNVHISFSFLKNPLLNVIRKSDW